MSLPNIVYINSHDTGRVVRPYGFDIPTPNYQLFAEQGVLFRQAFCAGPTCSPSRAALLTGQCPHSAGMMGLAHGHHGWKLKDYRRHLLHTLRDQAGYHAVLCGFQHVIGFDEIDRIGYDEFYTRDAEFLAVEFLERRPVEPFYLEVGFFETHRHDHVSGGPFSGGGRQGDGRYVQPLPPMPDTPETRADMADFAVGAERLDRKVGLVLDALEETGLSENTLVIITTDHGLSLPGMKCRLTDLGIGVLLMMRGPGPFNGGRVVDGMVSHIDVFPTLCEWLGLAKPDWLQGRSLMPLLTGDADEVNEEIFAEVTHHAEYEPMRAVRTKRWKYIRYFDGLSDAERRPVLRNCDASPSREVWLAAGGGEQCIAGEQLYDLRLDAGERVNLAWDPGHAGVLEEMRGRLGRWMEETADPLLSGPVPKGG